MEVCVSRPAGPRCRSEGPHREDWPAFPTLRIHPAGWLRAFLPTPAVSVRRPSRLIPAPLSTSPTEPRPGSRWASAATGSAAEPSTIAKRSRQHEPHCGGDFLLAEQNPFVHEFGAQLEGDGALLDPARDGIGESRARTAHRVPIRASGRPRTDAAITADARGWHPDHANPRTGVFQPARDSSDQAAPADGHQNRVERLVTECGIHFETDRPLPRDDVPDRCRGK